MIEFTSDKIKITGPKMDGGYTVTFEVGEYMQLEVVKLLAIPQQLPVVVCVYPAKEQ